VFDEGCYFLVMAASFEVGEIFMTPPDLTHATQKLARAREHIAETDRLVASFLKTDFYRLRLENNIQLGRLHLVVDKAAEVDKRINSVIGDAISNLRSVLDYLAVALVLPITGRPDNIGFPFSDDVSGFSGQVTKTCLSACGAVVHNVFIEEVQAYEGGKGDALWRLNKLRNIDKHRFLLTTAQIIGVKTSGVYFPNLSLTVGELCVSVVADQGGYLLDIPGDVQFKNKLCPTFQIDFNEAPYAVHVPVVGFLNHVAREVERVLKAVEAIG
jgi:hypothetical protein